MSDNFGFSPNSPCLNCPLRGGCVPVMITLATEKPKDVHQMGCGLVFGLGGKDPEYDAVVWTATETAWKNRKGTAPPDGIAFVLYKGDSQ